MDHDIYIVLLYIDPGIGFFAVQMVVGSMLGAVFYFRRAIRLLLTRMGIFAKNDKDKAGDR